MQSLGDAARRRLSQPDSTPAGITKGMHVPIVRRMDATSSAPGDAIFRWWRAGSSAPTFLIVNWTAFVWNDAVATWEEVGRWCLAKADRLRQEWNIQAPSRGSLPSAEVERRVDDWCATLALDVRASPAVGEAEKPWIVVRLMMAGAMGRAFQDQSEIAPAEESGAALRILLIAEWHRGGARDLWKQLPPLRSSG